MATSPISPKKVVFVHPDLGIGGAERLVIDAAVGLQSSGHKVTILTSHCDPKHCFEEARDGTLDVRVRGDKLIPPSFGGRFSILCAILRQLALVFTTAVWTSELKELSPDVFFVDQLSACVPLLRILYPEAKVLFYGHFPDRLLAKKETGLLGIVKPIYRVLFDAIESWSTGCADSIAVNSKFTRTVFKHTFAGMKTRELKVIYPCVDAQSKEAASSTTRLWPQKTVFLSINRFERKKSVDVALRAFAGLSPSERSKSKLVIAGGFDPRVPENAETLKSLELLASDLKLSHATLKGSDTNLQTNDTDILFLLSIPDDLKRQLLNTASLLLYTPSGEHFGIVPIEAMLAGLPVLATNSGGPLETIYDGRTGWLRNPEKTEQWTDVMRKPLIPSSAAALKAMGEKGRERVLKDFSQAGMTDALEQEIQLLVTRDVVRPRVTPDWLYALVYTTVFAVVFGMLAYYGTNIAVQRILEKERAENATASAGAVVSGRDEL